MRYNSFLDDILYRSYSSGSGLHFGISVSMEYCIMCLCVSDVVRLENVKYNEEKWARLKQGGIGVEEETLYFMIISFGYGVIH